MSISILLARGWWRWRHRSSSDFSFSFLASMMATAWFRTSRFLSSRWLKNFSLTLWHWNTNQLGSERKGVTLLLWKKKKKSNLTLFAIQLWDFLDTKLLPLPEHWNALQHQHFVLQGSCRCYPLMLWKFHCFESLWTHVRNRYSPRKQNWDKVTKAV